MTLARRRWRREELLARRWRREELLARRWRREELLARWWWMEELLARRWRREELRSWCNCSKFKPGSHLDPVKHSCERLVMKFVLIIIFIQKPQPSR